MTATRRVEPPTTLRGLDVEVVRLPTETSLTEEVASHPLARSLSHRFVPADAREVRRRLRARSLKLSEAMAPSAYQLARTAQRVLGVSGEVEIYQRAGAENASIHLLVSPILLEIHGELLARLDESALLGALGHELGHFASHGASHPSHTTLALTSLLGRPELDPVLERALSRLSMAAELTADRWGLLACQDLAAMMRLEMVSVTGLAGDALHWDTEGYLAQSRDVMEETLRDGAVARGTTHPEHHLRAYALWLFSETKTYRALTGRGPGTRALEEVNQLLERLLVSDTDAHFVGMTQAAEPPRELHEFALASSVLIAQADGEISEPERATLDRTFSSLVHDWHTYLDVDVALERFHELAPIMNALGDEYLRGLFHFLVHVHLSDGVVHERELEMMRAIGGALDREAEFTRWLRLAMDAHGVSTPTPAGDTTGVRLPARRDEVEDATTAYLRAVGRRGGSTTTLRRLFRLGGGEQRTEKALDALRAALDAHRITCAEDLDTIGIDERLVLTAATEPHEATPRVTVDDATKRGLLSALRRLREQLVSGDGRSPSVRLRKTVAGRSFDLMQLEKLSVGQAERVVEQVRAGKTARLVDAAVAGRAGAGADISRALVALAREDAARAEEAGAHDLFVGYPFLTGMVDGYAVRAPLVLYPVMLDRGSSGGAAGFRLRPRDGEPAVANQSLLRLVFNKRKFDFSDALADELEALASDDPGSAHEKIVARLVEIGWSIARVPSALQAFVERDLETSATRDALQIEETAVLGLFPQSSSDILQDYDGLLADLARDDADVGALLAAAAVALPASMVAPRATEEDPRPADGGVPVIAADPTQRRVIAEARLHPAMVVDGPPGTGKSQVIVNLVADALRRGERVAVVCEKRAALDVVRQRLDGLGFGGTVAVVHDVKDDRKDLYRLVGDRLEAPRSPPFDGSPTERARRTRDDADRTLRERLDLLRHRPDGLGLSVAELMTLAAGLDAPVIEAPPALADVDLASVRGLSERLADLHELREVWSPASIWESPTSEVRASLGAWGARDVAAFERALGDAAEAARHYESVRATTSVAPDDVVRERVAITAAASARAHRTQPADRELFGRLLPVAVEHPSRVGIWSTAVEAWRSSEAAVRRFAGAATWGAPAELVRAAAVLQRWAGNWLRFFVLGWWLARTQARASLRRLWPEKAGEPFTPAFIDEIVARLDAERARRVIGGVFDQLQLGALPRSASELGDAVERVGRVAPSVLGVVADRAALERVAAWPRGSRDAELVAWEADLTERERLLVARDALDAAAAVIRARFPWVAPLPTASELTTMLVEFRREGRRVVEADGLFDRAAETLPGVRALVRALRTAHGEELGAWRRGLLTAWADAWFARLERDEPGFVRVGAAAEDREVDRAAARLDDVEEELRRLEIAETLARIGDAELVRTESAEKRRRRTPQQRLREDLLRETRKKRALLPLRSFVRRFAPGGLLDVVPVWLLSPETMAVLFPREALFDLVIFDEASQCTVEAGLPVLLRARRVIVAGDEKQMPPSRYFALGAEESEDDIVASSKADDTTRDVADMLAAESLLTLARTRCAHRGLAWHYRCREESLIAFSNHAMYGGGLHTIPSTSGPTTASAIRWVRVTGADYESGENRKEAESVVDVLAELLARTPAPSAGVVTFNLKQRRAILDAIETRRARDDEFDRCWLAASAHPSLDERPFVKNLESVQGDERDVIVFSLGHAPVERRRAGSNVVDSYVAARFGPLGQRGGERRLNVAVSRAKTETVIVASFEPSQLGVAASKNDGPKLFKQFLEYARALHEGRRLDAARTLDMVRGSHVTSSARRDVRLPLPEYVPVAAQLALALDDAGIRYETEVGASDFKVPVAVLAPRSPERFSLAILIDDGTDPVDPFDLFVHRRRVLEQRGWRVLRIDAATWLRRRGDVLERVRTLLETESFVPA